MLQLVACILLLNFAQIEMMFMVSLVLRSLRHQFLGHQATLLMIEHRRRRRRRARRHNPYSWKLVLVLDPPQWTIPREFIGRKLRMDRCTFETLLNVLRPAVTRENTKLPDCIAPEKVLARCFYRLAHENSQFQSWKIDCSRGSSRCWIEPSSITTLMVGFTTNDRQVYHGFVCLVNFAKLLPGTNFVSGASENLSASAKNYQVVTNHPHL